MNPGIRKHNQSTISITKLPLVIFLGFPINPQVVQMEVLLIIFWFLSLEFLLSLFHSHNSIRALENSFLIIICQNIFMSIVPILIAAAVIVGPFVFWLAVKYKEFRKFLAGAFFVSAGLQFYFWKIGLTIPFYGSEYVQLPEASFTRGILHFVLFLLCYYYGFVKEPNN